MSGEVVDLDAGDLELAEEPPQADRAGASAGAERDREGGAEAPSEARRANDASGGGAVRSRSRYDSPAGRWDVYRDLDADGGQDHR